jgi:hypothetical protein
MTNTCKPVIRAYNFGPKMGGVGVGVGGTGTGTGGVGTGGAGGVGTGGAGGALGTGRPGLTGGSRRLRSAVQAPARPFARGVFAPQPGGG